MENGILANGAQQTVGRAIEAKSSNFATGGRALLESIGVLQFKVGCDDKYSLQCGLGV